MQVYELWLCAKIAAKIIYWKSRNSHKLNWNEIYKKQRKTKTSWKMKTKSYDVFCLNWTFFWFMEKLQAIITFKSISIVLRRCKIFCFIFLFTLLQFMCNIKLRLKLIFVRFAQHVRVWLQKETVENLDSLPLWMIERKKQNKVTIKLLK